jgi:hypothetical protein
MNVHLPTVYSTRMVISYLPALKIIDQHFGILKMVSVLEHMKVTTVPFGDVMLAMTRNCY